MCGKKAKLITKGVFILVIMYSGQACVADLEL